MKILITFFLMTSTLMSCFSQKDPVKISESFVNDIKKDELSNQNIIDSYFSFRDEITQNEKNEVIFPLLTKQIDLLRNKLNDDCSKLKVIKHDDQNEIVNDFGLKYSNTSNVYYVFCNNKILFPILFKNDKIVTISTHAKTKNGAKGLMIF